VLQALIQTTVNSDQLADSSNGILVAKLRAFERGGAGCQTRRETPQQKLLIVDDEPSIRYTMSQVLIEIGFFVRSVEDGFSAFG
jgi:hypothetical protein